MKVASKACAVIFLGLVVTALTSAEQESRAGTTAMRDFVLAGGVKSNLFATCSALANTVTGDLFSIDLGGGKEYQRFAPKNSIAVDWVKLNSSGASTDIIACSAAAYARNAHMFKFNGSCYAGEVTGNILYGFLYDEQDCGDAPAEVVYVMPPLSMSDGCIRGNSDNTGLVFNDNVETPYDPELMPQKLTCCKKIIAGHCVAIVQRPDPHEKFAYCEAKARCEALGLQLASYELEINPAIQQYALDQANASPDIGFFFYINTQRGEGGYYRWLPDGQNNTIRDNGSPSRKCAEFNTYWIDLFPIDCGYLDETQALCIGPNTSLQEC
ncbi:uncharacterized protein LOC108680693 [Hyalella azteca]|uniref:Uncharacterized protein LOC108680693 n=1 Tax=Hyalella azteca TaxID=294128 RepID=A0A8B7PFZ7_HYAAZ|nr:uncharacterized protein LOC108680693 [Hyalella azteca]